MREEESKLIGEGQQALAAEVSAKAQISQLTTAERRAERKAESAKRTARLAGPTVAQLQAKAKAAVADMQKDEQQLVWTRKVGDAEIGVAARAIEVAQLELNAAKNKTKDAKHVVSLDNQMQEQALVNAQKAERMVQNSGYVPLNETVPLVDTDTTNAAAEAAMAAVHNESATAQQTEYNFNSQEAKSDSAVRAAAQAAFKYGKAATAEHVALQQLKAALPANQVDQFNAQEQTHQIEDKLATAETEVVVQSKEELEQNAKELQAAKGGQLPPTNLGESNGAELHSQQVAPLSTSLGEMIHKAQISLYSGEAEEALDTASRLEVNSQNNARVQPQDATMLKLQAQLNRAMLQPQD